MEYVTLGRNGPKVSAVGIGMWQAGGKNWGADVSDEDTADAMVHGVELGMNLVDTAEVYGNGHSEEVVARAIRRAGRENVFVATKVSGDHLRAADVEKACKGSLGRLGVEAIDLYQIHWPALWDQIPLAETMKALEKLERNGKIRHIGVSNFSVRYLEEARSALSRTDIVEDQIQYSLLHREPEIELLPYCEKEGIGILAWSPLAKGILTGKYHGNLRPKDPIRSDEALFKPGNLKLAGPTVRLLKKVGHAHGKTPGQVALAWLRSHEGVVPIPGVKRPAQAEENAGGGDFALTPSEVRSLDRASAEAVAAFDTF